MKKRRTYKVMRGSFEEQQLREENRMETQRALMFILPIIMVAVMAVGIYLGYQGYRKKAEAYPTDFETAATEAPLSDPMLLSPVNSARTLEPDYVPFLSIYNGVEVSYYCVDDLDRMMKAAVKDDVHLILKEGYISYDDQKKRYENAVKEYKKSSKASTVKSEAYVKRTIPREGESECQTGLLLYFTADGDGKFEDTAAYRWLMRNSVEYGFVLRYPEQENTGGLRFSPHLFRYVGADNAYFIRAYDMNFDEYTAYLASQ